MPLSSLYSINCRGKLISLEQPLVAGILNITPDSFYETSRTFNDTAIINRVKTLMTEGADIIDIGAYSSRPGADHISSEEEIKRLHLGLKAIKNLNPDIPISIDTFRSDVAKMAIEEYGADIINDISGGELDAKMFKTVAELKVPYILMHMQGNPQTMQLAPKYNHFLTDIFCYFAQRVQRLRDLGVNDIILDPGFGFGKTLEQNYELMQHLSDFAEFDLPLLVGVSRKSMIYKLFNATPHEALNGTTVLHTYALLQGAHILRVHDVKPAVEAIKIVQLLQKPSSH